MLAMYSFLIFFALAIFIGLNELFPTPEIPKDKFEARLEKDFLETPDPFFENAIKNAHNFEIQKFGKSKDIKTAEIFFQNRPLNPNGTQKLELAIFDGEKPNLIVLQFSLFDKTENKIGEWAKSYLIADSEQDKKKPR
jgi:hypothetical protein